MDEPADAGQPFETTADAVRDYAAVVDWVLARRHLDKLDVMGWSWGTTIAGGFAAEQPTKVNRLVLYAPDLGLAGCADGGGAAEARRLSDGHPRGGARSAG